VEPGDFILNHVGFAIRRIPPEEAAETLALYDELLRLADEQDLMTADVRAELEAAPDATHLQKGAGDESE
jgi:hydrogenase expression/formation protein HypC